jgi:hypothetical protein
MSQRTEIFQIYFKPELVAHLDPKFTPMDNTDNPAPELREWDKWNREHEAILEKDLTHWGYVSWKFKEKTNLSGEQVFDWMAKNPGHDVYLFNPCIANEALFANNWEQGDVYHPGISAIGNKFLAKLGHTDIDVKTMVLDRNKTVYANFVVGSRDFWIRFMEFSRKLFTEAEKDPVFKDEVFGAGRSNYAADKTLPNFTFLIERLIPTFIELEGFKSLGYDYGQHPENIHPKYHPVWGDIRALSDLKVLINQYGSDDLYNIWHFYRTKTFQQHPQILGLE